MIDYEIQGSKGGSSKPHTPVETPNNLLSVAYAKVLLAVAEGELAGQPTDKDIYLDGTPLQNEDGSYNFGGVKWEWRSGSQDQEAIEEFPEVSTEYSVGIELKDNVQWTRAVTKSQLTDLRVTFQWPALMEQASNGDTNGYKMQYAIDLSTDGGAFQEYQVYTIDGKTNTSYERTHKVKLPKSGSSWTIRARRVTPESSSSTIQDTINVKSYAEVVAVKQRYPNTALLYVEFDSRLFGTGNIPKISVKTKGRVIQVPTNYNPETRTYSGIWDGSFKWAWTNNPAWVFYDLLTQDRFGLGHKVTPAMIDKLALYEIAQYCDVLVDDGTGSGTKEPRHTCNIYIQDKAGAWKVLRDIAGMFNGMTYWDGNKFVAVADKWEPITNAPLFSRSNVVNGNFDYQAADDKSIYTSALVSYDDPDNHYNTDVEPTFETSQILRWGGDRQIEITAIGCTSRGEAQRKGKYTLITNLYNRTVSFQTGLQGLSADVLPGKIIHVLDPLLGGRPYTGRIKASAGTVITLDRDVTAVAGDILYLTTEDGSSEGRTVVSATDNIVTVSVGYSKQIPANSVWYLESSDLKSQLFRVTKVTNPSANVYEIEGVEYNESKYGAIDNGARLEPRPVSVVPPGKQQAPTNLVVTSSTYVEQTMAVTSLVASWDQTPNAVQYEVQWRYNDGDWLSAGITGSPTITVKGIYTGNYIVRVRAINAVGVKSIWTTSTSTRLDGKVGGVPALASLTTESLVFGIGLKWQFPQGASDTARTEIMYSENSSFASAIKLGDFSYPTDSFEQHGLKAGQQFWYWGRLIDRTGNIGPWTPLESTSGVVGVSSTDQTKYEEYFSEQISESALYKELSDRIDLIDGPASLPGSVNDRVKEVADQVTIINSDVSDLQNQLDTELAQIDTDIAGINTKIDQNKALVDSQINSVNQELIALDQDITNVNTNLTNLVNTTKTELQTQINTVDARNTLPWKNTGTYTTGQIVQYTNGKLYRAKSNVPANTVPTNTTYWLDIGDVVVSADGLAARVSTAEQSIVNIDGRVTANSTSINSLQTQVNGKADATALNSLTTRVATAEGKIDANTSAITSLTTTVNGKADASALTALSTRVTTAEGKIDNNATAITNLTTTVNGKADASAVTALTTRVATAEGKIDANTSAITGLNASIGNIGGNGTNLIPAEYTVFTDTLPTFVPGSGITIASVADAEAFNGYALRMNKTSGSGTVYFATGNTYATANIALKNKKYIASLWAKSTGANKTIAVSLRTINSVGTVVFVPGVNISITGTWARYSVVLDASNATTYPGDKMVITVSPGTTADNIPVLVDRVMLEEQVGTGVTPSAFTPGTSFAQATANATATQALTVRVTQNETDIAAQAQQITNLTTTVAGKADSTALNALTTRVSTAEGKIDANSTSITNLNSSLTTTNNNVTAAQNAANAANTLAGGKGKVIYGSTTPAVADRLEQNIWIDTTGNANTPKRWNGTAWVAVTDKVATDAAAAAANALAQVATKAEASAVTALTTRVTTVEGKVDSQATSITNLNSSLTTTNNNVTAAQNAADAANTLAGGKGKVFYGTTEPATSERLSQNLWIDTNGGANTPKRWNGSAWVAVTDKVATDAAAAAANALAQVATKADASAVTSLTTRVTAAEGKIDTNSLAITSLSASIGNSNSENIVLNSEYKPEGIRRTRDTSTEKIDYINYVDAPAGAPQTIIYRYTKVGEFGGWGGNAAYLRNGDIYEPCVPGEVINLECQMFCETSSTVNGGRIAITYWNSAGVSIGGNQRVLTWSPTIGGWQKLSAQSIAPAGCAYFHIYYVPNDGVPAVGFKMYVGNLKVSRQTGEAAAQAAAVTSLTARVTTAEGTITSNSTSITSLTGRMTTAEGNITANTNALSTLQQTVTSQGNTITSQGQAITSLTASVGVIGSKGSNLLPSEYSVFNSTAPTIIYGGGITGTAVADAAAFNGYAMRLNKASGTGTTYFCNSTSLTDANMSLEKKKYLISMWAKADVVGHQFRVGFRAIQADGTVTFHYPSNMTVTDTWARYTTIVDMTTTPAIKMILAIDPKSGSGAYGVNIYVDKIMVEELVGSNTEPSAFVLGNSANQVTSQGTALNSLTTRVTAAEGTITSQGQAITSLTNTVNGKADSSALTALSNRVTTAEGNITANATAITNLTTTVNGKADASALSALTTRVTTAEGNITSQGSSITSLNNTVNGIGGAGANLLPSQYSWLTSTTVPPLAASTGATYVGVAVPGSLSGYGISYTSTNTSNNYIELAPSNNSAGWNISLEPGDYIVSYYASSPTEGAAVSVNLYGGGAGTFTTSQALTTTRTRYSHIVTVATAMIAGYVLYPNRSLVSGTNVIFDSFMVEKRVAGGLTASPFVAGPSASEVAGNASALTALTTRVTTVEGTVTTQGSSITNLTASLGNIATDNLLMDPTFTGASGATNQSAAVPVKRNDADVPVGAPSANVLKWALPTNTTGNTYMGFAVNANVRTPESALTHSLAVAEGEIYDFEMYYNAELGRQHGLWIQMYDAAGTSVNHNWAAASGDGVVNTTASGVWTKLTGSRVIPAGVIRMAMTFRIGVGNASMTYISSPVLRKRSGQENAQATAQTALEARVTTAEGTITSQSSSITSLTNSLAGKADNSALTALSSRVTTVEGTVSSQGSAITQVQSTLGGIGGNGNNLLEDTYSWLTSTTLPTTNGSGTTTVGVAVAAAVSGFGYKMTSTSTSTGSYLMLCPTNNAAGWNIPVEAGTYLVSFYASTPTAASLRIRLYSSGLNNYSVAQPVTSTRTRYTHTVTLSAAGTVACLFYYNMSGVSGTEVTVDSVMVERQIGTSTVASPFVAGPSAKAIKAQATAISNLQTTVTQQGDAITAQTTRVDGIYAQVNPEMVGDSSVLIGRSTKLVGIWTEQSARVEGDVAIGTSVTNLQAQIASNSAAIQQVSSVTTSLDGKTSAMWGVKMEVNSQGQYVAAGIGLGIENGPAGLQSQFLVSADKFAVVNGVNGTVTTPFVVSGGQVFIREALITKAMITNAIIGSEINSSAMTNWGGAVMSLNFDVGQVMCRHPTRSSTYTIMDRNGIAVVVDGVIRVRMGVW